MSSESQDGIARRLTLGETEISDTSPCYVVAEVGHNHQGSLETARKMFAAAKEAGASAVKLQKRHNRSLYTDEFFRKPYENPNSFGPTYGEHREALEFGRREYVELKAYAEELGIDFFATAFDQRSADFLAGLDMPAYKIASGDLTNTPLLRYVAEIGKPIIVSTGGGCIDDVRRAYDTIMPINSQLAILQCTAAYPAPFDQLNLGVIGTYRAMFPDTVIGLSSHDNGIAMAVAAYCLGARIVEKHFTLDRAMRGTDHAFSLEPQGMHKLNRDLRRLYVALGDGRKTVYENEVAPIRKMGKKLVAARALPAGHILAAEDIAAKSPGDGLPPCELDRLVGGTLRVPVDQDVALHFDMLESFELTPESIIYATNGARAIDRAARASNGSADEPEKTRPLAASTPKGSRAARKSSS
jgi:sialic acid synthase